MIKKCLICGDDFKYKSAKTDTCKKDSCRKIRAKYAAICRQTSMNNESWIFLYLDDLNRAAEDKTKARTQKQIESINAEKKRLGRCYDCLYLHRENNYCPFKECARQRLGG